MARLFEGWFWNKNKTVNGTSKNREKTIVDNMDDAARIIKVDNYNVWQIISRLRDLNDLYKHKYAEYEAMAEDVIIQSALELYADDSTQFDTNIEKIVKLEVKNNSELQNDLNALLEALKVDSRIWQWAYDLSKSGDLFLKVNTEDDDGNNIFTLEDVEDPSDVMDLWYKGQRVAFAEQDMRNDDRLVGTRSAVNQIFITKPDKYVHFMIKKSNKTDKLDIDIPGEFDEHGQPKYKEYSVVRGTSMLEGVRPIYRIIQLLEDSLLAAKVAMSEFVRVYNIEVGDDTPKKTTETINRVKNLFDQKASFDVSSGRYKANKEYRPVGDPIFNPVRNGKGSVTHEDIGGDFEVKDITDMDYFNNKLFAGLKIPKAYLGFEESLPGGLGDNTLTRLDIRYSRSIKRVQVPLCEGIKEILLIWCAVNGREVDPSDILVTLMAPSSSEELARLAEINMRMDAIDKLCSTIKSNLGDNGDEIEIFEVVFNEYIHYADIKDKLAPIIKKAKEKRENTEKAQEEEAKKGDIVTQLEEEIERLKEELKSKPDYHEPNPNLEGV